MSVSIQRQADQWDLPHREASVSSPSWDEVRDLLGGRRIQAGLLNTRQASPLTPEEIQRTNNPHRSDGQWVNPREPHDHNSADHGYCTDCGFNEPTLNWLDQTREKGKGLGWAARGIDDDQLGNAVFTRRGTRHEAVPRTNPAGDLNLGPKQMNQKAISVQKNLVPKPPKPIPDDLGQDQSYAPKLQPQVAYRRTANDPGSLPADLQERPLFHEWLDEHPQFHKWLDEHLTVGPGIVTEASIHLADDAEDDPNRRGWGSPSSTSTPAAPKPGGAPAAGGSAYNPPAPNPNPPGAPQAPPAANLGNTPSGEPAAGGGAPVRTNDLASSGNPTNSTGAPPKPSATSGGGPSESEKKNQSGLPGTPGGGSSSGGGGGGGGIGIGDIGNIVGELAGPIGNAVSMIPSLMGGGLGGGAGGLMSGLSGLSGGLSGLSGLFHGSRCPGSDHYPQEERRGMYRCAGCGDWGGVTVLAKMIEHTADNSSGSPAPGSAGMGGSPGMGGGDPASLPGEGMGMGMGGTGPVGAVNPVGPVAPTAGAGEMSSQAAGASTLPPL